MPAKKLHYSVIFFFNKSLELKHLPILKLDKYIPNSKLGQRSKNVNHMTNVDFVQFPKLLLRVPASTMMYKLQKEFLNNEGKNSSAFS